MLSQICRMDFNGFCLAGNRGGEGQEGEEEEGEGLPCGLAVLPLTSPSAGTQANLKFNPCLRRMCVPSDS